MNTPGTAIASILDRVSDAVGRAASWLTFLMVIATFVIVVLRYAFGTSFIWLQESLTWMHAVVFMLGASYTLQYDEHVRVDIFYRDMPAKRRALVNLLGVLLFLFPLCIFIFYQSFDYVSAAWSLREISRDAGGLPYPAIPLLKSLLLLMPLTVGLQGLAMLLTSWRELTVP
jgi:TRAP-type mannitol/chloroaromatic compound transport system permease small subunit